MEQSGEIELGLTTTVCASESVASNDGATPTPAIVNEVDVQNEYNDFGQMKTEYQQHGSAVNTSTSPKVQYGYANGSGNTTRRESLTYPNANVLDFEYGTGVGDELSRVEKLAWKSTDVVEYDYLGLGQVVVQKYPEPTTDVEYNLTTDGTSTDPYAGMDRSGA